MKKIISIVLCAVVTFTIITISSGAVNTGSFTAVTYPDEAITKFSDDILDRVSSGDDYESNRGYDETGLYNSPYWQCEINGESVPAYGILTFNYTLGKGVVQSFSRVQADLESSCLSVNLTGINIEVDNSEVLPKMYGVKCTAENDTVSFGVENYGSYTILINNDDQRYVFTLFVDKAEDEDTEISELIGKYGSDRVLVFDSGYYETEYIDTENYDAVYFKAGSYVAAKHVYDVRSDEDVAALPVRKDFFSASGKTGFVIKGSGVIDLTALDRKERESMCISGCTDTDIEGLTFINSPTWTLFTYACNNISLKNITVFGYRTNSDGINICGSCNVNVSDCYIRNGDDCYSVKATNSEYTCHDVVFENCIAYSTKARCFGLTGEAMSDIYDITFKNSAVIYRDATWDNDRVSSLAISIEYGGGNVYNISFENIEIHKDTGRAVNILVYDNDINNCCIDGITFRNIACNSDMKSQIISKRNMSLIDYIYSLLYRIFMKISPDSEAAEYFASKCGGNSINVTMENADFKYISRGNVLIAKK